MSLGVKFGLVISIVAASLCCIASFVVYSQTEKSLLAEIDRKGVAAVKSVGGVAKAYYDRYTKIVQDKEEAIAKKDEARIKEIQNLEYQTVMDFTAALKMIVSLNPEEGDKTQELYSEEILNVCILQFNLDDIKPIQAGEFKFKDYENTGKYQMCTQTIGGVLYESGVEVTDGVLSVAGKSRTVKTYRLIVPETNKVEAYVSISKKDIEHTTSTVMFAVFITTLVAILIAIIISIILAGHVTRPLRFLIEDVEQVSRGDLDHTTSATSRDEIGILARTFNVMTQNLKIAHQAELERQARDYELKIATDIQSNLLPSQIPMIKGYEVSAFYQPSKEVGGDYYDFLEIDPDHLGFIVADVSGKSIPGSMVMTMTRAFIRMEALHTHSPAKMFSEVNRVLSKDIRKGMFVTAMYGVLKISTGEFTLSSAGHNPAILWRHSLNKGELVNPKGVALGLSESAAFDRSIKEEKYQIQPGDCVVLYTDGVPEAMSPNNEEFGDERLYKLVAEKGGGTCNQLVNTVVQTLEQWRKKGPQSDDITIVVFKRT